jgi:hypothetical protein
VVDRRAVARRGLGAGPIGFTICTIWRRGKPDALLHHSERGSQYTSEQFQRLLTDHGVICSMSRSGNVWDNAAMESFFFSRPSGYMSPMEFERQRGCRSDCCRHLVAAPKLSAIHGVACHMEAPCVLRRARYATDAISPLKKPWLRPEGAAQFLQHFRPSCVLPG